MDKVQIIRGSIAAILLINALVRNDWTSVTLVLVVLIIVSLRSILKHTKVDAVASEPLQAQIDDLNNRYNEIKDLAEEAKKQISLHNLKQGFKHMGSKE